MYQKAAKLGHARAQTVLASMYFKGEGVPRDYAQAAQWFRLAAEQGQPLAQNGLGWMYLKCLGVKCDSREAAEWFRKSAEQGYAIAQDNLAYLFEHGQGVPVDYPEAHKWYQLAAARGNSEGRQAMNILAQIMTPKQLREAESRASAWQQRNNSIEASAPSIAAIASQE
jgi:hypothetical protein